MPLILYAFIFFTLQGTPQTTITVNMTFISKSALDAEDSPPPIPPKLSLDDEFDDDPPPPIPPKLFLDNSLPIPHMKLPKSRGPQQTGKNPSSQWQTILVLLNGCGGKLWTYVTVALFDGGLLLHCLCVWSG